MRYQVWLYGVYNVLFESDDLDKAYEYILSVIKDNPDKYHLLKLKYLMQKQDYLSMYIHQHNRLLKPIRIRV